MTTIDINVNVSKDELIKIMEGVLSAHPHNTILARVIVNNLTKSPVGISQLVKGLVGLETTTYFKVDDVITVPFNKLPTWRLNENRMREEGMLFQGRIEATILNVDLYDSSPLTIEYEMYDNDNKRTKDNFRIGLDKVYLSDKNDISLSDDE